MSLPLLSGPLDAPFAWPGGEAITRGQFLAHVARVAAQLPDHRYAVNLCENRYLFTVAFAAVLVRGQTNLLPPNRTPQGVNEVAQACGESYCVSDGALEGLAIPLHRISPCDSRESTCAVPNIDANHVAAILFTSGSTGQPRPHTKRWGEFIAGARATAARLGLDRAPVQVVATVPPQHMFGLETSVILPLAGMATINTRRPLFPQDVSQLLADTPSPRALVTTPFHLRTFTEAAIDWPEISFVLSATAPLSGELAAQAERAMGTRVLEIYGSTETGAMATRRTAFDESWHLIDGFEVIGETDRFLASAPHLGERVALNDVIEMSGPQRFRLLGRCGDIISVAGKRGSLGDLNHRLNAIEGVQDGVFLTPGDDGEHIARLAALVVAPDLSEREILDALRRSLDPVFLPRPLLKVERLPRNEAGKLPRQAVLDLLRQQGGGR